jgi:hypothetical protein
MGAKVLRAHEGAAREDGVAAIEPVLMRYPTPAGTAGRPRTVYCVARAEFEALVLLTCLNAAGDGY